MGSPHLWDKTPARPAPLPVTLCQGGSQSQLRTLKDTVAQDALCFILQEAALAREATAISQRASSNLWSHFRRKSWCQTNLIYTPAHAILYLQPSKSLPPLTIPAPGTIIPQHCPSQPFTSRGVQPLTTSPYFYSQRDAIPTVPSTHRSPSEI